MKLKSKFIEGTDGMYSIRNDGVIVSHYLKTRGINSYRDKILRSNNSDNCGIYLNGKKKTVSVQRLLYRYFGFKRCKKCNNKHYVVENNICESCDNKRKRNDEIKRQDLLTKDYVSKCMQIPSNIMTDELYESRKALIKVKRLLAKKLNCSIYKIK
jgi:hypothetical protein